MPKHSNIQLTDIQKYFPYVSKLTAWQEDAISSILNGNDTLVIFSTGGDKSICYQYPAIVNSGLTVVVSPLISWLGDQVFITNRLIKKSYEDTWTKPAVCIHGSSSRYSNNDSVIESSLRIFQNVEEGRYKMLYLSPDIFMSPITIRWLKRMDQKRDLSLIVLDEVHHMTMWGLSIRTDYLKLDRFRSNFDIKAPIAAFAADANKNTRAEVLKLLAFNNPTIIEENTSRNNLEIKIENFSPEYGSHEEELSEAKRYKSLLKNLYDENGRGIIYCSTQESVDILFKRLKIEGLLVSEYHAGMETGARHENIIEFAEGRTNIMVATSAFGMNMDIPDIRFVYHYNVPQNIECYYQEISCAGRDGDPACCRLFYMKRDTEIFWDEIFDNENQDADDKELNYLLKRLKEYRLIKMQRLCIEAAEKEDPTEYILNTIQDYLAGSWSDTITDVAKVSMRRIRCYLKNIDFLYMNETLVCSAIRDGRYVSGEKTVVEVPENKFVSFVVDNKLDYFDMMVYDAVCTFFSFEKRTFRIIDILRILSGMRDPFLKNTSGDEKRTHDIGYEIAQSIDRLMRTNIEINVSYDCMWYAGKNKMIKTLKGSLLSVKEEDRGQYSICCESPLYTYAMDYTNGQFRSVRREILRNCLQNSKENLVLTHLLVRRVIIEKSHNEEAIKNWHIRLYNRNNGRRKMDVYSYIRLSPDDYQYSAGFEKRMKTLQNKVDTILLNFEHEHLIERYEFMSSIENFPAEEVSVVFTYVNLENDCTI
jgi:RecQ family ATP-dependent DNA helicase